jgi:hypothetical protein
VGNCGEELLYIHIKSPRQLALDLSHALITVMSREGRLAWAVGSQGETYIQLCAAARQEPGLDVSVLVVVGRGKA